MRPYTARSGSAHVCQDLYAFVSGIWRLPGAPTGKGPAASSPGRAERWLRGLGRGLGGNDAAGLGGHTQLGAGAVPTQGTGGGKAPWGQGLGWETPQGPLIPQAEQGWWWLSSRCSQLAGEKELAYRPPRQLNYQVWGGGGQQRQAVSQGRGGCSVCPSPHFSPLRPPLLPLFPHPVTAFLPPPVSLLPHHPLGFSTWPSACSWPPCLYPRFQKSCRASMCT